MERNNQEIDLLYLVQKIKEFFTRINLSIFRLMQVICKNWIWLTAVVVSTFAIGYFVEKQSPKLQITEMIVSPNFQSNDYLYERIEVLKGNKYVFTDKYPSFSAIKSMKIEQIENYYDLLNKDIEAFKALTNNGYQLNNVLKDGKFEKDFRYHKIKIVAKDEVDANVLYNEFIAFLNNDPYLEQKRIAGLNNLKEKRQQLAVSIEYINNLLKKLGNEETTKTSDLNVNTYAQLHEVIELKEKYGAEITRLDTQIIEGEQTIFPVSKTVGIPHEPFILLRYSFLFPFVSLMILYLGYRTRKFYKKYAQLAKEV